MVDCTNGSISYSNVAKAIYNSSWACDSENVAMFCVGENGKACLFDISMGSMESEILHSNRRQRASAMRLQESSRRLGQSNQVSYRSKERSSKRNSAQLWQTIVPWFEAHKIMKMDP